MTLPLFVSPKGRRTGSYVPRRAPFSPLVLADRLIGLAQEADRAGYPDSAERLLGLMFTVLDEAGAAIQEA